MPFSNDGNLPPTIRDSIAGALRSSIAGSSRVDGGDVASSFRLDLVDRRTVFAKTHANAPANHFRTEATGLHWIKECPEIRVPEVLAVSDDPPFLVLEWIDQGAAVPATESSFGRSLAALHRLGAPTFGRLDRRTTGSRGLPNEPCSSWAEFYATQRLLPLARLAHREQSLRPAAIRRLENLALRLEDHGGVPDSPARLHGDLWSGNRLVGRDGDNWLIDPAAHGGHPEFDLAMMRLFGGFGEASFIAYSEERPLADGWPARIALHQLAPLVVHAIKFGGNYPAAVESALATLI